MKLTAATKGNNEATLGLMTHLSASAQLADSPAQSTSLAKLLLCRKVMWVAEPSSSLFCRSTKKQQ